MQQDERNSQNLTYGLTGKNGMFTGARFTITGETLIGRDPACDIRFPADTPLVSRRHCSLRPMGGRLILRDLGSSYGTFLEDGTKLIPHTDYPLTDGCAFSTGSPAECFRAKVSVSMMPASVPAYVPPRSAYPPAAPQAGSSSSSNAGAAVKTPAPQKKSHGGIAFLLACAAILLLFFNAQPARSKSYATAAKAPAVSTSYTPSSAKKTTTVVASREDNKLATVQVRTNTGYGTGVVLEKNKDKILVITAYHVVDQGRNPRVDVRFMNGQTVPAANWHYWEDLDIAFVYVNTSSVSCKTYNYIKTAKLKDVSMEKNDKIYGIAFYSDKICTTSGVWQKKIVQNGYNKYQTSLIGVPGASGGGLFTDSGYMIGILLQGSDERNIFATAEQIITCKSRLP
ncbi:MAG: FHA domain-containing protein [Lachnospiraceae bacterium]|nr:FHA domain-containing protein [Lachnospiraceae bacterium]